MVDWHNYSHTILAMALSASHPLVRMTHYLERMFGRSADGAFCVTKAMRSDLHENWRISAKVLYDRPPETFRPISKQERSELFSKLTNQYPVFGEVTDKTGVIVSSTSWTEDEDFGVLLNALVKYEFVKKSKEVQIPELLVVITGKGPQKEYYLDKISKLNLEHVKIVTPWLETEDYPRMLASADLGVCLHTSSSGLDLPMKVVDMFGCRLPVAAVNFPALSELVQEGVNGKVFETSDELSEIIQDWFRNFPEVQEDHTSFRNKIDTFRALGWSKNWDDTVLDTFKQKDVNSPSGFVFIAFFICVFCLFSSLLPTAM